MIQQSLLAVQEGKRVIVANLNGGVHLINKLNSLGIRVGITIIKIGSSFLGGPVTIQVGTTKVALGRRMASKIMVEVK